MKLRWIGIGLIVALVVTWWATRDTLPDTIRVATAYRGGLYHRFGEALEKYLERRTGHAVELIETAGSAENEQLLERGEADLAIMQLGSIEAEGVAVVAPLYREAVHVVVRIGSGIASLAGLAGRRVSIGPEGSGMRESARAVLAHHGVDGDALAGGKLYFRKLLDDAELEAAVVTTGMLNPDLHEVMATGRFVLVPVDGPAAISVQHPYFDPHTIPRGLFRGTPALPDRDVATLATTAVLAVRRDSGSALVQAALETLYEDYLRTDVPALISRGAARDWDQAPVHPQARDYHDPYEGLNLMATALEGLAGFYELLFAIGAGLFLIWRRRKIKREEENERLLKIEHERLDRRLDETVRIERAQMDCTDIDQLEKLLDEVTVIKLGALEQLSHEDLRGDPRFLIFLTQCANLIRKIQTKLLQQLRG
jgi:TRAP transporter TAXI family solute receptor